jgi:hypothetical protein
VAVADGCDVTAVLFAGGKGDRDDDGGDENNDEAAEGASASASWRTACIKLPPARSTCVYRSKAGATTADSTTKRSTAMSPERAA